MLVRVAMVISQDWSFSRIVPSNPIVPCRSEWIRLIVLLDPIDLRTTNIGSRTIQDTN